MRWKHSRGGGNVDLDWTIHCCLKPVRHQGTDGGREGGREGVGGGEIVITHRYLHFLPQTHNSLLKQLLILTLYKNTNRVQGLKEYDLSIFYFINFESTQG